MELQEKEERRRQKQLRNKKIREIEKNGGFKRNVTPLYHNIYGEGVFVGFDDQKKYIYAEFDKETPLTFPYPDSIEVDLFIHKTDKILKRREFLSNRKNVEEDVQEKKFFQKVCKVVDKNLDTVKNQVELMKYRYNDFSDSFDSNIHDKRQNMLGEVNLWYSIRREPYFARVDYGKETVYIGKNSVTDLVIDWRDKVCNLYYKYNIYIGNTQYNLSLVRDFEIISGIYCGFIDKYSSRSKESNIISDKFLLNIINANRDDKKTHDIIQTIQRNQYEIITYNESKNMLLLGCAGSGKTMIMFHRLSYMIFNHQEIDIVSVYIISPNKLLNIESDELSQTLKINKANRLDQSSFNISLIKQYYNLNQTYNHNQFNIIQPNTLIDDNFIKYIYSDSFINGFKKDILSIILSNNEKRKKFLEFEEDRLLDEYRNFLKDGQEFTEISVAFNENKSLNNIFNNVKKIISELPLNNVLEKIKKIDEELKSPDIKDNSLKAKRELLKHLSSFWEMSDKTIYQKKQKEISVEDKIFKSVFSYFNVLGRSNKDNKNILDDFPYLKNKYSSMLQLMDEYKKMVEKIQRFEDFKKRINHNYFSEMMNQLIFDLKYTNKLDCKQTYEFEVFLHLMGCKMIFNKLHHKRVYIFIDEFHDYAITELALYREVFSNAVFNFFGDVKQSINVKGLNESDMKQVTDGSFKVFNINENYRNARQITEYINSVFRLNMMPIGINGLVNHYNVNKKTLNIELEETDRIAFIVKDISLFEEVRTKITIMEENINMIENDECIIKKGFLNVIPIILAKGLEFEQVYVFPDKMTKNEIYVAYTRALNNLYVLSLQ